MLKILVENSARQQSVESFSGHYSKIFDLIATIDVIEMSLFWISVHIWFANVDTLLNLNFVL